MEGLNFIKNKSENKKKVVYHVVIMQCLFIIMSRCNLARVHDSSNNSEREIEYIVVLYIVKHTARRDKYCWKSLIISLEISQRSDKNNQLYNMADLSSFSVLWKKQIDLILKICFYYLFLFLSVLYSYKHWNIWRFFVNLSPDKNRFPSYVSDLSGVVVLLENKWIFIFTTFFFLPWCL